MPSPLAHIAAGFLANRLTDPPGLAMTRGTEPRRAVWIVAVVAFFSLLPDSPSLIGSMLGDFARFHNGVEHSLAVGLLVGLLSTVVAAIFCRPRAALRRGLFVLLSYELHVLMDYLTWGRGVKLLWPFSADRYSPPFPLFYGLHWSEGWLSTRHLLTLGTEILFVLALGWLLLSFERRSEKPRR